jgi:hypothetical protein
MDHKKSNLFNFSLMSPLISFKQFSPKNQNSIFSSHPPFPNLMKLHKEKLKTQTPLSNVSWQPKVVQAFLVPFKAPTKGVFLPFHKNPYNPQNHDITFCPPNSLPWKLFLKPFKFSSSFLIVPYPMHLKFLPSERSMVQWKILSHLLKVL